MGSYPLYLPEIERLERAGVTAVLNIMDEKDLDLRGIDMSKMLQLYHKKDINLIVNLPVIDEAEEAYVSQLFQATKQLHDLVDVQGHKVFLHDTTGVSRAPTLFLAYQALYVKARSTLREMSEDLGRAYPIGCPNMKAVQRVLDENSAFVDRQRDILAEDEKLQRLLESDRKAQLRKEHDQAEFARLKDQAEHEVERLRLQRLQFEEAERVRLQQLEEEEKER